MAVVQWHGSSRCQQESGQSQFATLKLRSLALVPSSGARCAPTNSTYGSSTARLSLSGSRRSRERLSAVPRPGAGVPATNQRFPYAEVKKKRSSERLCPAEPSRDLRLGLSVPSSPSSRAGRHTRFRAIKEKLKIFENFFGPKHIYFCSDFLTKTSPSAVSHLYHAPYKRLIYSRVSKTLHSPAGGVTLIPLTSCEEAQCMQS